MHTHPRSSRAKRSDITWHTWVLERCKFEFQLVAGCASGNPKSTQATRHVFSLTTHTLFRRNICINGQWFPHERGRETETRRNSAKHAQNQKDARNYTAPSGNRKLREARRDRIDIAASRDDATFPRLRARNINANIFAEICVHAGTRTSTTRNTVLATRLLAADWQPWPAQPHRVPRAVPPPPFAPFPHLSGLPASLREHPLYTHDCRLDTLMYTRVFLRLASSFL